MNAGPDRFLSMIRAAHRGRHKIYLGYSAGVGKTCQMLKEALRLRDEEGLDVVIGLVETHGRAETAACKGDLEEIPRVRTVHRGVTIEEMDLGAILMRHPQVVLVDELAHTNMPGSANAKRYQDVETILESGINVISTLNVQHLEGLYETVEKTTGIRVTERLPDWVVARADEVVNVDVSTEDLRERIRSGRIYPRERIETALSRFFVEGNLRQLRELALRELASHLDIRLRGGATSGNGESKLSPDQVLVCLSDDFEDAEPLLRFGLRLAGRLNRDWYVLHVRRSSAYEKGWDRAQELATLFGAKVFTSRGDDTAHAVVQFAAEHRIGHVVVGRPRHPPAFWDRVRGRQGVVDRLIGAKRDFKIIIAS